MFSGGSKGNIGKKRVKMRLQCSEKMAKYYVPHQHLSLFDSVVCITIVVKFSAYQSTMKYILAQLNFTIFLYSKTIDIRTSSNISDGNIFEILDIFEICLVVLEAAAHRYSIKKLSWIIP